MGLLRPVGPRQTQRMAREISHSELADVLRVTMRIGVLMLRSGAATFRTEQVMMRFAESMGVERLDAYITPTGIIASAYSGREHRTQIVKVPNLGVDLNRVVELELLSRNVPERPTLEEMTAHLDGIEAQGQLYRRWQVVCAVGLACGAFAPLLGGGPLELVCAALAAATGQTVRMRLNRIGVSPIPTTVVCAAIATAISYLLGRVGLALSPALGVPIQPNLGIIASVLFLVPGVPLVTAVLDLTRVDLVSGTSRGAYALILFTCIALGMLAVLVFTGVSIV